MGTVHAFPTRLKPTVPSPATVFIAPVEDDGGSWGIFQSDRHGERMIAARFAFAAADAEARRIANEIGATFDDGSGSAA